MPTLAIAQDLTSIEKAVTEVLDLLEPGPLLRGKQVAVKANDTWANEADTSGVTQPDTLRAVLRYIKELEPAELVVTGGAGAAETDEVFRVSGMMRVLEEEDVEFFDHNRPPFEEIELDYGDAAEVRGPQRTVRVNPRILEYERLVSLSQLKMHETATVTLALKNIAMSFPAADYYGHPRSSKKHENDFFDDMHSFIAAMAKRFPIDLALTVGHPAMVATGPLGDYAVETGLVIGSDDPLVADAAGARLLSFNYGRELTFEHA